MIAKFCVKPKKLAKSTSVSNVESMKYNKLQSKKLLAFVSFFAGGVFFALAFAGVNFPFEKVQNTKTVTLQNIDLKEEVSVEASVKPEIEQDIFAQAGGMLSKVYVKEGDKVYKGQTLAHIEQTEVLSLYKEALANLNSANFSYEKIKNGARKEDIELAEQKLKLAKENLNSAKQAYCDSLKQGIITLQNTDVEIDKFFQDDNTEQVHFLYLIKPYYYAENIQNHRKFLTPYVYKLKNLQSTDECSTLFKQTDEIVNILSAYREFLANFLAELVSAEQTDKDNDFRYVKKEILSLQSGLVSVRDAFNLAQKAYDTALISVYSAETELKKIQNGNRYEDVQIAKASRERASASVLKASKKLNDTIIKAPADGVISKLYAKEGEYIFPGKPFAHLVSEKVYLEIEIPEVYIPLFKEGADVGVAFDAYPGERFQGTVVRVFPDAIERSGIIYYRGKVLLENPAQKVLLPKMSAEVQVEKTIKENTWALPKKYLNKDKKGFWVYVLGDDNKKRKVYLEIGKSNDEFVEVLNLSPEAQIEVYVK